MVQRVVAAAPQLQLHLFRSTDDKLLVSYPDQHRRSLDVAQVSRLAAYIDEVSGYMPSWHTACESNAYCNGTVGSISSCSCMALWFFEVSSVLCHASVLKRIPWEHGSKNGCCMQLHGCEQADCSCRKLFTVQHHALYEAGWCLKVVQLDVLCRHCCNAAAAGCRCELCARVCLSLPSPCQRPAACSQCVYVLTVQTGSAQWTPGPTANTRYTPACSNPPASPLPPSKTCTLQFEC